MLVDSSIGVDLNNAGDDLQGVDILWDVPQVITVARLRYANGTRMEYTFCNTNADEEDYDVTRSLWPVGAIPLRGYESDTLGCGHGDEYTSVAWIFH
ncbi:hypothetical protein [Streptomyces sp. NPDC004435]|uniref:hypothetical protein n=1 Tax=Streptomyces sp. NPDC004435 TaxID=3364701 RepID=UPI00367A2CF1